MDDIAITNNSPDIPLNTTAQFESPTTDVVDPNFATFVDAFNNSIENPLTQTPSKWEIGEPMFPEVENDRVPEIEDSIFPSTNNNEIHPTQDETQGIVSNLFSKVSPDIQVVDNKRDTNSGTKISAGFEDAEPDVEILVNATPPKTLIPVEVEDNDNISREIDIQVIDNEQYSNLVTKIPIDFDSTEPDVEIPIDVENNYEQIEEYYLQNIVDRPIIDSAHETNNDQLLEWGQLSLNENKIENPSKSQLRDDILFEFISQYENNNIFDVIPKQVSQVNSTEEQDTEDVKVNSKSEDIAKAKSKDYKEATDTGAIKLNNKHRELASAENPKPKTKPINETLINKVEEVIANPQSSPEIITPKLINAIKNSDVKPKFRNSNEKSSQPNDVKHKVLDEDPELEEILEDLNSNLFVGSLPEINGEMDQELIGEIRILTFFINSMQEGIIQAYLEGMSLDEAILFNYEKTVEIMTKSQEHLPDEFSFGLISKGRVLPIIKGNKSLLHYKDHNNQSIFLNSKGDSNLVTTAKDFEEIPRIPYNEKLASINLENLNPEEFNIAMNFLEENIHSLSLNKPMKIPITIGNEIKYVTARVIEQQEGKMIIKEFENDDTISGNLEG